MINLKQNIINELKIKVQLLKNEISKEYRDTYFFSYDDLIQAYLICEHECGIKHSLSIKAKKIEVLETKIFELEGINYPSYWRARLMAMEANIKKGTFTEPKKIKKAAKYLTFLQTTLQTSELQERFTNDLSKSKLHIEESISDTDIIEKIIYSGESNKVEFKSTLRWNIKEERYDDEISYSIIKTIAAFLNTKGGVLLIGIEDNGNIIGIKLDKFKNDDTFVLYLFDLIKNSLGKDISILIDAKIVENKDKKVCFIQSAKSPRPIYCTFKKKNEEFFIRSGPSSVKLALKEVHNYISENFNGKS